MSADTTSTRTSSLRWLSRWLASSKSAAVGTAAVVVVGGVAADPDAVVEVAVVIDEREFAAGAVLAAVADALLSFVVAAADAVAVAEQ